MKFLMLLCLMVLTCTANAGIRGFDQGNVQLGVFSDVKCGLGNYCAKTSGKFVVDSSHKRAVSADTTATAAMCGSTFVNSASVTVTLPEASSVQGCRFTFVTGSAGASMIVDPADTSDQILILTNAAGDRISNSTLGNSVIIEAVGNDAWAPIGKEQGTYTDAN